jgi:GMP synthase-like glutamine amidotransferase
MRRILPKRASRVLNARMIDVLQCGELPAALKAEYGSYGVMVRDACIGARPSRIFDVTRGEYPAAGECSALVLTGSPAGVYEDLPWIPPLLAFLRQSRGKARIVGICFGHQAMAQAFGGQVVKSPKGWGIGVHRYAVVHRAPWMADDVPAVRVAASHQDQVVVAPAEARVVLESEFTPYAGLDYGDAISFQGHPEFTPGFGCALIASRPTTYGALAAPAIASYAEGDDRAMVRGWIGRFLDRG